MKQFILGFLFWTKVPFLLRWLHRDRVAVLMYHGIMPDEVAEAEGDSLQVRASDFRRQMEFLKRNYEVCSLHEAYCRLGKPGPKPRAVVTFDDGYANNYLTAFPILRELGIPATIFVVTGRTGTSQMFWWDRLHLATRGSAAVEADFTDTLKRLRPHAIEQQIDDYLRRRGLTAAPTPTGHYRVLNRDEIAAMAATGLIEFGCHTHDHQSISILSKQELQTTVRDCNARLEAWGGPVRYFAAPYGDYDDVHVPGLRQFDFELALSTDEGFLCSTSDPFRIPRFGIDRDCSLAKFACITSGLMLWIHRCKLA